MKVEAEKDSGFKPIVLTITLETLGEARAMYHIFNHAKNAKLIKDENAEQITSILTAYSSGDPINNGVRYSDFYAGGVL